MSILYGVEVRHYAQYFFEHERAFTPLKQANTTPLFLHLWQKATEKIWENSKAGNIFFKPCSSS
jgi:hypothetical protein